MPGAFEYGKEDIAPNKINVNYYYSDEIYNETQHNPFSKVYLGLLQEIFHFGPEARSKTRRPSSHSPPEFSN